MFDYIKGIITFLSPEFFVLESQGVGYKILTPINLYTSHYKENETTTLYVSLVVREDAHRLFGFATRQDRDFFEKLLALSGVGPKTALNLIGHMTAAELKGAIQMGNSAALTRIPGIGKKTADRIIVELSDRIHKWKESKDTKLSAEPDLVFDALSALINLGYNQAHAQKAIQKALEKEHKALPSLITSALREL